MIEPEGVVARGSSDALAIDDAEVAAAARFIRDHATEGIGLDDVAAATGMSRASATRRFKAAMRRSIHAEIERVRLERAKQLLAGTDLPMKRIAILSGFRCLPYLSRRFRLALGQTPAEFRQRERQP